MSASGWLYRSTFVLFDYDTESLWYHMDGEDELTCIGEIYCGSQARGVSVFGGTVGQLETRQPRHPIPQIPVANVTALKSGLGRGARRPTVGPPRATLALLVVGLLAGRCWAGAWVQEPESYFLKVGSSYFSTTEEFNHLGDRLQILEEQTAFEDASFRDANLNLYLEYGLTENTTLVTTLPFKGLRSERDVLFGGGLETSREIVNTVGFGDITLSVRRELLPDPLALSIQTGIKFPLGYAQRPANDGPPLGTAKFDGEIHLLAGRSLWPLPGYVTGSLGFRRRGGRLNDEVVYGIEIGCNVGPLLAKIGVDGIRNRSTPPDIAGRTVVNTVAPEEEAFCRTWWWGINISVSSTRESSIHCRPAWRYRPSCCMSWQAPTP